jgi:hypothetical protein
VSDNLYWWAKEESTLRELNGLAQADVDASLTVAGASGERKATVQLKNSGTTPVLLVKLTLQDASTGARILPAYYSENYVSMLPGEERTITIAFPAGTGKPQIGLRGWNLANKNAEVR